MANLKHYLGESLHGITSFPYCELVLVHARENVMFFEGYMHLI